MQEISTSTAQLARAGFHNVEQVAARLAKWAEKRDECVISRPETPNEVWQLKVPFLSEVQACADPDQAVLALTEIDLAQPELLPELIEDPGWSRRVVSVLGGSTALAQHLTRCPTDIEILRMEPVREDFNTMVSQVQMEVLRAADPIAELPLANRRQLIRIAARDLLSLEPEQIVDSIAAELADLADALMGVALEIAEMSEPESDQVRFAIIALGKCGAQELNYVSDIDVLFLAEPAMDDAGQPVCDSDAAIAVGSRLAASVRRMCSDHRSTGALWAVDAALRPEGKAGPLVRSMASMRRYYEEWAKNWEYQAMLKSRFMAGDPELGTEFVDMISELVWEAAIRPNFVPEVQSMRRRVVSMIGAEQAEREIKLGSGGLRDVEFSVQLLQLVHGRSDQRLRHRGTLPGLRALVANGYVGRRDGAELESAYRFQRTLEHRIQLHRLRRTHLIPVRPDELRVLARSLGIQDPQEVIEQFRASCRRVERLHRKVFYSPLLDAVARIPSEELRLTTQAAIDRLSALGYGDPEAALARIKALTTGMTRQVEIQRQLLPAMLGWFAEGVNPDHGLKAFQQVSEALGRTPWYLRALRDEGLMAQRLAHIFANSRYCVDLVRRAPQTVGMLADDSELRPADPAAILGEMRAAAERHDQPEAAIEAIRAVRRRELFRLAAGDLAGVISLSELGHALSSLTNNTVTSALEVAARNHPDSEPLAVIAMGRWGGQELAYASDADALFVSEGQGASGVFVELRRLLAQPGAEPPIQLDVDLRPEGKGGPMVRGLESYGAYYERWADTWEYQALLRAHYGGGDEELAAEFLKGIDQYRWPESGLKTAQVQQIRKLKVRMETERMPHGINPRWHLKLGPGGLSDVEWTVQLMQLRNAHKIPDLRTTNTGEALDAIVEAELMEAAEADLLREAWRLASRIRNAIMLTRGRAADSIPTDASERAAIAHLLGYDVDGSEKMVDDYLRVSRRAGRVVTRYFWES